MDAEGMYVCMYHYYILSMHDAESKDVGMHNHYTKYCTMDAEGM